jgi:hypothetical protein
MLPAFEIFAIFLIKIFICINALKKSPVLPNRANLSAGRAGIQTDFFKLILIGNAAGLLLGNRLISAANKGMSRTYSHAVHAFLA